MAGQEAIGFSLDHPGFGGLTFARPALAAGDPITGFAADGLPVFGVHVLPGTIRAVDYDHFPIAGEGRTYHDTSAGNAGAQYRADDVDIACSSEGRHVLTNVESGEWVTYTVHVPAAGNHRVDVRYAATAAGAVRVAFGGSDVTPDVALPATGGAWRTLTIAGNAALRAGVQALRVTFIGGVELESVTVD